MHRALSRTFRGAAWRGLALLGLALWIAPIGSAQSLPDLVLIDFTTQPERIEPGRSAELIATVTNDGRSMLFQSFNVSIQVDNELIHSELVPGPLAPDATVEVRGTWEAPTEGDHRLRVRVDPFNRVQEANEENNELRTTLTVDKPRSVRSYTAPLLTGIAGGLTEAGQALQVEHVPDTFQLISKFQSAFDTAESAYNRSFRSLNSVTSSTPAPFQTMPQMAEGERVARLYSSMASDFKAAKTGLARAQVQALLDAFEHIRSTSEALGTISQPEFDLRPLGATSALLDEALVEAGKLQDALNGKPNVDVDDATANLVDLLGRIGTQWRTVGTAIADAHQSWSVEFADPDGAPIARYEAGEPMTISVSNASSLTLFVYNEAGDQVYVAGGPRRTLLWRGTDPTGAALPAGTYYYRLLIGNGTPRARVELGEIRISAPIDD